MSPTSVLSLCLLLLTGVGAQSVKPIASRDANSPIVDLGYVKYLGYTNATAGVTYYRGIPYAQPPVDELRWRQPRPIEAKNDFQGQVINATVIAPACYQSDPYWLFSEPSVSAESTAIGVSEDCLILDVYVPAEPASTSLPVLVQIHGGGYTIGNAQIAPGDALVHASNGSVIYVSIQYRLGLFGFLGGRDVAEDGAQNAGLRDQRAALEWVQRNIRAFGGDPARVTITGGSAGGGSVSYQLIAGGATDQPPFSAAIPEYPWWQPLLNASSQERQYRIALSASGCSDLNCLRSLSADRLMTLNQQDQNNSYPGPGNGYGVFWFGPTVDGDFVRQLPGDEFRQGHFYNVPFLVDHDQYEGVIFTNQSLTTVADETADAENLFPYAGPSFFTRLYALYPPSAYNSTFFQRQTWFGDFIINCMTFSYSKVDITNRYTLPVHANTELQPSLAPPTGPTYYMATAYIDSPNSANTSQVFKMKFAAGTQLHGATSPFLYSNTISYPGANNQTLAEIMTSYWLSFVKTYDPNPLRSSNAPFWPSYLTPAPGSDSSAGLNVLDITYNSIDPIVDLDASPQCDFFSSRGHVVRN